jgi:ABC-type glycerol-3-phosphate transport system substrate-binding protein
MAAVPAAAAVGSAGHGAIAQSPAASAFDPSAAKIDWQQFKGHTIRVLGVQAFPANWQKDMLPEFEKLTGIKVVYEQLGENQLHEKAVLELSSRSSNFDLIWTGAFFVARWLAGRQIVDLREYLDNPKLTDKAWYDYEDIYPSVRNALTAGNRIGAIPFDAVTHALFYRKDVFDKEGIKVPKTMDELEEVAKRLTKKSENFYGISLRGAFLQIMFPAFPYTYGGGYLNDKFEPIINDPKSVAGTEKYVRLVREYAPIGSATKIWSDVLEDFRGGLSAMLIDTFGFTPQFEVKDQSKVVGKVGVADVPGLTADKPGESGYWTWCVVMNALAKEKGPAWLYMQWASSKKTALQFALRRWVTARKWVTEQKEWQNEVKPKNFGQWHDVFLSGIQRARPDYLVTSKGGRPIPEAEEILKTVAIEVSAAIAGQKTAKQGCEDAAKAIRSSMERAGYYR